MSFTAPSFDEGADYWDSLFDCSDFAEIMNVDAEDAASNKFDPAARGAEYLAVVKVMLTGDDHLQSEQKVEELFSIFHGPNVTNTETTENTDDAENTETSGTQTNVDVDTNLRRRRLVDTDSVAAQRAFSEYAKQCMQGIDTQESRCGEFLGLNLVEFDSLVSSVS